jgi:hypothetical protein
MSKSPVAERIGQGAIAVYALIASLIILWGLVAWGIAKDSQEPKHYVECAVCHEEIDDYARFVDEVRGPVCVRCDK